MQNTHSTIVRLVRLCLVATATLSALTICEPAQAQFGDTSITDPPAPATASKPVEGSARTEQWKVGVRITAKGGPCGGLLATLPVPMSWDDQRVEKVSEDTSSQVRNVKFRELGGVRQMIVSIPRLNNGEVAQAIFVYEVDRKAVEAPTETDSLTIPKKT